MVIVPQGHRGIGGVLGKLSYLALQFRNSGLQSFPYLHSDQPGDRWPVQVRDTQDMQLFPESGGKSDTTFVDKSNRNRKTVAIGATIKSKNRLTPVRKATTRGSKSVPSERLP